MLEVAVFGNKDGSHNLLWSTLPAQERVLEQLRFLVDRPAGHVGDEVVWWPYWGCGPIDAWWVLWRGQIDLDAPRKNMVSARAVLLRLDQIDEIDDLDQAFSELGGGPGVATCLVTESVVDALVHGHRPAIIPDISVAPILLRDLWKNLWPSARGAFSMRTLFGPDSLDSGSSPAVVLVPQELRPRWLHKNLVTPTPVSTDPVRHLLGGDKSSTLARILIENKASIPPDLSVVERLDYVAARLNRLHGGIGNPADALTVVRILASFPWDLCLSEKDRAVVFGQLCHLESAAIQDIRAASLVEFSHFKDISLICSSLSKWVSDFLPEQNDSDALWIIEKQFGLEHAQWWRDAIANGIRDGFKTRCAVWASAFWRWIVLEDSLLSWLESLISEDHTIESELLNAVPDGSTAQTVAKIRPFLETRKWNRLLARLLRHAYPLDKAIEVLSQTRGETQSGLTMLLEEQDSEVIVRLAGTLSWKPLQEAAIKLTVERPSLFECLSGEFEITQLLVPHIEAGGAVPASVFDRNYVNYVFNGIVAGDQRFRVIAETLDYNAGVFSIDFADARLWSCLDGLVRPPFMAGAVSEWWRRFIEERQLFSPIGKLRLAILGSFRERLKSCQIVLVIEFIEEFNEISERDFIELLSREGFYWGTGDAERLSVIILERHWRNAAREFRLSWKQELVVVAWHCRGLLTFLEGFFRPPHGVAQIVAPEVQLINSRGGEGNRMKVLFLAANPVDSGHLAIDEEHRAIEIAIKASKFSGSIDFSARWAVRPEDLQQHILETSPTVIHFSGHGGGNHGLLLHGLSRGQGTLVKSEPLVSLLEIFKQEVRVVVLNACHSEHQAEALANVIDFVIGMSDSIGDEAARVFATAFYRGLAYGRPVKMAFDLGIADLKMLTLPREHTIPRLYVKEGVDPSEVLVATAS